MCSRTLMIVVLTLAAVSCSPYRKMQDIRSGNVSLSLSVPDDPPVEEEEEPDEDMLDDDMDLDFDLQDDLNDVDDFILSDEEF